MCTWILCSPLEWWSIHRLYLAHVVAATDDVTTYALALLHNQQLVPDIFSSCFAKLISRTRLLSNKMLRQILILFPLAPAPSMILLQDYIPLILRQVGRAWHYPGSGAPGACSP